jgi:biopolymer transport protein ExbB
MQQILESTGVFLYPLILFSLVAAVVVIERIIALRPSAIIPRSLVDSFVRGDVVEREFDESSLGGRIVRFYLDNKPDPEGLKAFARLQVNRMQRGLYLLDIVVAGAPLLGLLGTVTGLVQVFSGFSPETGMPDPGIFVQGIALALTTTILGLGIAIPALIGSAYLNRRVENLAARLEVGVERLIDLARQRDSQS